MLAGMYGVGLLVHGGFASVAAQFAAGVVLYLAVLAIMRDSFLQFAWEHADDLIAKILHR